MIIQLRKARPGIGEIGDRVEVDETLGSRMICSGVAIHAKKLKTTPRKDYSDAASDKGRHSQGGRPTK